MGKVSSILGKIFIVIMALITLFPFVYMISEAMKQAPFGIYFINTIFVEGI